MILNETMSTARAVHHMYEPNYRSGKITRFATFRYFVFVFIQQRSENMKSGSQCVVGAEPTSELAASSYQPHCWLV